MHLPKARQLVPGRIKIHTLKSEPISSAMVSLTHSQTVIKNWSNKYFANICEALFYILRI